MELALKTIQKIPLGQDAVVQALRSCIAVVMWIPALWATLVAILFPRMVQGASYDYKVLNGIELGYVRNCLSSVFCLASSSKHCWCTLSHSQLNRVYWNLRSVPSLLHICRLKWGPTPSQDQGESHHNDVLGLKDLALLPGWGKLEPSLNVLWGRFIFSLTVSSA